MQITSLPEKISRESYKNLCLLSTISDPKSLSNNPEKYKDYTQAYREEKVKQSKQKKIYVAIQENRIIGTITAKIKDNNGFLSILYVDPAYRGVGIASKLMEVSIQYLKNNGCLAIYLRVYKEQKTAIHLYKNFGFSKIKQELGNGIYNKYTKGNRIYFIKYL